MKIENIKIIRILAAFCILHSVFLNGVSGQENPPAPSAPKTISVPAVKEKKLPNNLTLAVVERRTVPLVTVKLLVKSGAESEGNDRAGLANLTASLLTKGTKTRTATKIAEQIEFLGGSINSGAGWNNSVISINITSDKLEQAMAIMSDVVLNPNFDQKEIDLLKSQTLDGLTYNLKQPSFLANYVASAYSYSEHPASGTPASIGAISRSDIVAFHQDNFEPQNSVLIFAGDITASKADALATQFFGSWKNHSRKPIVEKIYNSPKTLPKRILVVDLPNSGQAAVNYTKNLSGVPRTKLNSFFPATVLNSLLGGGYSSRLNQEIRIKRGLSYGAGSSFAWREGYSNFGTRTQTKNESAAEVAELVLAEVNKLAEGSIAESELTPRKSVLTGGFGRNLETTQGLAAAVADLYSFGLPASELNSYMTNVQTVSDKQIMEFASANLQGGDIVIVGDYSKFKDDLAKRFPNVKIELIKASELDLSKENLQK
jgi:zinc protease